MLPCRRKTSGGRANRNMEPIWEELYRRAAAVRQERRISPFVEAGGVAAALLTGAGNIYTGVCIDTACSLGMCAERNAIANMITNGEHDIHRLAVVMPDGQLGQPCGACRELMMQLGRDSGEIEILTDLASGASVRLRELCPDWWTEARYDC